MVVAGCSGILKQVQDDDGRFRMTMVVVDPLSSQRRLGSSPNFTDSIGHLPNYL